MKSKRLPYGYLTKVHGSDNWYWRFYNHDKARKDRVSLGTQDEREAYEIANRMAIDYLVKRDKPIGSMITLEECAKAYLCYAKPRLSAKYFQTIALFMDAHLLDFFPPATIISEIRTGSINEFIEYLSGKGLKEVSISKYINNLSQVLKYAARHEYIDSLPYIPSVSRKQEKIGYAFSRSEMARILLAAKSISVDALAYIGFGYYCGLRHSETIRIEWDWLDYSNRSGYLDRQKNKTDKPFPFLRPMLLILNKYPIERRTGVIIHGCKGKPFVDPPHQLWIEIRDKAGVPGHTRYHDLRHTFTTRWDKVFGFRAMDLTRHNAVEAYERYRHQSTIELFREAEKKMRRE